jgi:DNA invertase Pin-like site-specific DNA recombinase
LGMDTQTPTGKLMLTVLGRVAQFEREGTAVAPVFWTGFYRA